MDQTFSIFFTFDLKSDSLIISSDENFVEEQNYGISTIKEQEFSEIIKNITLNYLKSYKKKYNKSQD